MFEDGRIVSVVFLALIIAVYAKFSIDAWDEITELRDINNQQIDYIKEQEKEISDLKELVETMFIYIERQQGRGSMNGLEDHPWYNDTPRGYNKEPI